MTKKLLPDGSRRIFSDREAGTYSGLVLSLRDYRDRLQITPGYQLNKKPRQLDCLVIDKIDTDEDIENDIARLFLKHNIIELKNPTETLNIRTVWKTISYAAQYISDECTAEEVTITILRAAKPVKVLKRLEKMYSVKNPCPGIYYIRGMVDIKMQIVVTGELKGEKFAPLRIQRRKVDISEIKDFLDRAKDYKSDEMEYVEQILRFGVYEDIVINREEEDDMFKSFFRDYYDPLKEEIDELKGENTELREQNTELMEQNMAKDSEIERLKELLKKNRIAMF